MFKFLTNLTVIFLVTQVYGDECPSPSDVPVMNDEGTEFVCGERWFGGGSEHPIEGCDCCEGHCRVKMMDGDDCDNEGDGWCVAGSIIVKAGCTFYGWEDLHYKGDLREWHGPNLFPDGCVVAGDSNTCPRWCNPYCGCYGKGPRSAKCRCQQKPIICVPEDGYERIEQCNNCGGTSPLTCTYQKKVGTTYTDEAQNSMSIDTSIQYAMEAAFFKFFSESIGVSVNTGYDWTHTSSEAKSEEHTYTVSTDVAPGTIYSLDSAIGRCGGNVVKTELFLATTTDCSGNVLKEVYETEIANEMSAIKMKIETED